MKNRVQLDTISDGRLFDLTDWVEAGTEDCSDCCDCCCDVGDLVVLTPLDVHILSKHLNKSFDELLETHFNLKKEDKVQLPKLKMHGVDNQCNFLTSSGRCSVHAHRPDICRLFPLGRVYTQDNCKYFLQTNACTKPHLTLVQVADWIGLSDSRQKNFILAWYQLIKALTFRLKFVYDVDELVSISQDLLDTFYRTPYVTEDFYAEFFNRLPDAKKRLGIL